MLISGLVSVTFRKLTPERVCELARAAGLECIEWGGDVHVPGGDLAAARRVRGLMADHGLSTVSYGSYYRAGAQEPGEFARALETALELGAPAIRVWAGDAGSKGLAPERRARVVRDLIECGELALAAGVALSLEFHGGTLTDDAASAERLMEETAGRNVWLHWQPRWDWERQARLDSLALVLPRLCHMHAFCWRHEGANIHRLPLEAGEAQLLPMISLAREATGTHGVLLEFVEEDDERAFMRDAAALRRMMAQN